MTNNNEKLMENNKNIDKVKLLKDTLQYKMVLELDYNKLFDEIIKNDTLNFNSTESVVLNTLIERNEFINDKIREFDYNVFDEKCVKYFDDDGFQELKLLDISFKRIITILEYHIYIVLKPHAVYVDLLEQLKTTRDNYIKTLLEFYKL